MPSLQEKSDELLRGMVDKITVDYGADIQMEYDSTLVMFGESPSDFSASSGKSWDDGIHYFKMEKMDGMNPLDRERLEQKRLDFFMTLAAQRYDNYGIVNNYPKMLFVNSTFNAKGKDRREINIRDVERILILGKSTSQESRHLFCVDLLHQKSYGSSSLRFLGRLFVERRSTGTTPNDHIDNDKKALTKGNETLDLILSKVDPSGYKDFNHNESMIRIIDLEHGSYQVFCKLMDNLGKNFTLKDDLPSNHFKTKSDISTKLDWNHLYSKASIKNLDSVEFIDKILYSKGIPYASVSDSQEKGSVSRGDVTKDRTERVFQYELSNMQIISTSSLKTTRIEADGNDRVDINRPLDISSDISNESYDTRLGMGIPPNVDIDSILNPLSHILNGSIDISNISKEEKKDIETIDVRKIDARKPDTADECLHGSHDKNSSNISSNIIRERVVETFMNSNQKLTEECFVNTLKNIGIKVDDMSDSEFIDENVMS